MKVTRVEIQSYRSFPDPVSFDLADGMNVFVGRNNCGKPNLFAALTLALHCEAPFDRRSDSPAHKQWALPKIVLQFHAHANNASEKTLLRYAQEYEESLGTPAGRTYAAKGQLRLVVEYATACGRSSSKRPVAARGALPPTTNVSSSWLRSSARRPDSSWCGAAKVWRACSAARSERSCRSC